MLGINQPTCGQPPPMSEAEEQAAHHRNFALTIEDAIKRTGGISFTKKVALKLAKDQWLLADLIERYR